MLLLRSLQAILCAALLAGCAASVPPAELIDARQVYSHASAGQAAQLVPSDLEKARVALAEAEKSFQDNPLSFRTRDLAYIADRRARIAEGLAATYADNATAARAIKGLQATQAEIASPAPRVDRSAEAHAILAKRAAVKKGVNGLVISLSDSALFESHAYVLLPIARDRLNRVAAALVEINGQRLSVACYTDGWRPSKRDQQLSQQRADAVRSYIIMRGYPGALIQARGIDETRPADVDAVTRSQEGSVRLEIIIDYANK